MAWVRVVLLMAALWLLSRWIGAGPLLFGSSLRSMGLWAALMLAVYLLWRDGRHLLRPGERRRPLAILRERLARGEIDLRTYHRLHRELSAPEGIGEGEQNRLFHAILRGDGRD